MNYKTSPFPINVEVVSVGDTGKYGMTETVVKRVEV